MQKQIAMRIRSARQAARLTQSELAALLNLSRSAIAQWESRSGCAPSTTSFARLAAALDCSFEWLATGKGVRHPGTRIAARHDEVAEATVISRYFARDDAEERIIEAFRELDAFDRDAVLVLVEALSARPQRTRMRTRRRMA